VQGALLGNPNLSTDLSSGYFAGRIKTIINTSHFKITPLSAKQGLEKPASGFTYFYRFLQVVRFMLFIPTTLEKFASNLMFYGSENCFY
jgi:hypothetical protein